CRAASAATSARARAGSRSSAPGWSTRTCSASSRRTATTRSGCRASPSASGSSGWRCCGIRSPICAASSTTMCGCWSNSHERRLMRVPYTWLREYCDPGVPVEELAERLVMTGTEVERIDVVGPPAPDNFVIGKVTEAVQHPDADRLRVCQVEVGEDGPRTIVCGAPNVAAGQTVAVALPGARMPGGDKLRKAKLRGVASEGMIL